MNINNVTTEEILNIDHTSETVSGAFHISDEGFRELVETVDTICERNSNKRMSKSEFMTQALYACNVTTALEIFVVGQMLGVGMIKNSL